MKKVFFIMFFAIASFSTMNAQKGVLNAGFNVGLPTADANDVSNITLGAELNYMFFVSKSFTLGPSVEYTHFFGKDYEVLGTTIKGSDITYLPVSGAARFNISDSFIMGANVGYAIGLNEGNDGGFYYKPIIGYKLGESSQLNFSYSGFPTAAATFSNISLGIVFGL